MNRAWAESWERLGAAGERARRERLRRLGLEEGLREFERHSRVRTGLESDRPARSHAVGLARFWKHR